MENPIKEYFVYLLQTNTETSKKTYIGATQNLNRRLRQHNKEIKGGAIATGIRVSKGETWERVCYIKNFPSWISALQFEWRWKQISRKYGKMEPLKKRFTALKELLKLERPTTKSIPYGDWEHPPEIIFEIEELKNVYSCLS